MNFSIDYGSPGVVGAVVIVLAIGAALMAGAFLFNVFRAARDDVAGDQQDEWEA